MNEMNSTAYQDLKRLLADWTMRHQQQGPEAICQIQTAVISLEAYARRVPQSVVIAELIERLEHSRDDLLTRAMRN